jgi:hypothetical protein
MEQTTFQVIDEIVTFTNHDQGYALSLNSEEACKLAEDAMVGEAVDIIINSKEVAKDLCCLKLHYSKDFGKAKYYGPGILIRITKYLHVWLRADGDGQWTVVLKRQNYGMPEGVELCCCCTRDIEMTPSTFQKFSSAMFESALGDLEQKMAALCLQ